MNSSIKKMKSKFALRMSSRKRRRRRPFVDVSRDMTPLSCSSSSMGLDKKQQRKAGATGEKLPAELFRSDFITAMRVNENDSSLDGEKWLTIADPWRQEWNRGVQIPVDAAVVPRAEWSNVDSNQIDHLNFDRPSSATFKLPKKRFICVNKDVSYFSSETHRYVTTSKRAETICRYDLDDLDVRWLQVLNENRRKKKPPLDDVTEGQMERVMETLETDCYDGLQKLLMEPLSAIRRLNSGRELDENSRCDICNADDSVEGDRIVFCDGCDLAVHQACYGVPDLPEGQWLCRGCTLSPGRPPQCILCPNSGGALKCTRSGSRWAHVSCVLWIPEIRFGDPEALEPIVNVSEIPNDRWLLRCCICEKRQGACIQCSAKNCRTAYHVTCAQKRNLYMKISHQATGVKLVNYCEKHSQNSLDKPVQLWGDPIESHSPELGDETSFVDSSELTETAFDATVGDESPRSRKAKRMSQLEKCFYKVVDLHKAAQCSLSPLDVVSDIFEYWKLKRLNNGNRPLLMPVDDEEMVLEKIEREAMIKRAGALLRLRQNLEKARNLCYMVCRREKMKKQYCLALESLVTRLPVNMEENEPIVGQMSQREVDRFGVYLESTTAYDASFLASLNEDDKGEQKDEVVKKEPIEDTDTTTTSVNDDRDDMPLSRMSLRRSGETRTKSRSPKIADEAGRDINASSRPSTEAILASIVAETEQQSLALSKAAKPTNCLIDRAKPQMHRTISENKLFLENNDDKSGSKQQRLYSTDNDLDIVNRGRMGLRSTTPRDNTTTTTTTATTADLLNGSMNGGGRKMRNRTLALLMHNRDRARNGFSLPRKRKRPCHDKDPSPIHSQLKFARKR